MQRGFHIIFAAAAVDSVRRNSCSSYVSLGRERETAMPVEMDKGERTERKCLGVYARAYVCVRQKRRHFHRGSISAIFVRLSVSVREREK